jgi:hypothetical protein
MELVQLENTDWVEIAPGIDTMCDGCTLMLKYMCRVWAINQNKEGVMYVSEWKRDPVEVVHYGMRVKTKWVEVYRTNYAATDFQWYDALKKIVSDGDKLWNKN